MDYFILFLKGQNPDEVEEDSRAKGKKGGGKRKQRQTVSTFYKAQLGNIYNDLFVHHYIYRKIISFLFQTFEICVLRIYITT